MDQAIEHHERPVQVQVLNVVRKPEAGTVGRLKGDDQQAEPPAPDRDPHHVAHRVGVGPEDPFQPVTHGVLVLHGYIREAVLYPAIRYGTTIVSGVEARPASHLLR